MDYEDIGHINPLDYMWIFIDGTLEVLRVDHSRETHERQWGLIESETHWRGRYEIRTERCSIMPPQSGKISRPPKELLSLLLHQFDPMEFWLFSDKPEKFYYPNPGTKHGSQHRSASREPRP